MKRLLDIVKRETGLANSEAIVVSTILALLLIGWIGNSISPTSATHDDVAAAKVIQVLDTLLAQSRSVPNTVSDSTTRRRTDSSKSSKKETKTATGRIRLNSAPAAVLESLPGVGPSTAKKIVDARNASPFTSLNDVLRVPGIGPKKLEKMRPYIIVP